MTISTDKDRVRLLISDVGGTGGSDFVFSDDEILTFLDMRGGVDRAAATAFRTLAGNAALVAKRIKFLELETNGPEEAKALRELADALETQADSTEDVIDVAEMDVTVFSDRVMRRD